MIKWIANIGGLIVASLLMFGNLANHLDNVGLALLITITFLVVITLVIISVMYFTSPTYQTRKLRKQIEKENKNFNTHKNLKKERND